MKKFIMIVIILLIALTTTACNFTKKATEPVDLHILLNEPNSNAPLSYELEKLYKDTIVKFTELHPGITVTIDYITETTDLTTDESLDIIPYSTASLEMAAEDKILLDLLPILQVSGSKKLDIATNILDSAMIDGELLVLPISANPIAVLYNKDYFDEANIPYPQGEWTWEEFRDVSKKLKQNLGSSIPYEPIIFEMLLATRGNSMLSPTSDSSIGYLDSPEALRTIQWLNDYYHDDSEKTIALSFRETGVQFNNNRTGMVLGTLESYKFYNINLAGKLGVAQLPHFEDGLRANSIDFYGFGISSKSKHPQEAWSFIEYLALTNHDNVSKFAEFSLTTSKLISEVTKQESDPIKSIFVDEMNYSVPFNVNNPLFFNEELISQFDNLLTTDENDLPIKLQELALSVDQEINLLKIEREQKQAADNELTD